MWMSNIRAIRMIWNASTNAEKKRRSPSRGQLSDERAAIHPESRALFTSYGSVLARHQSRSICLTFLALGPAAGGHFWAGAADGLWRRNRGVGTFCKYGGAHPLGDERATHPTWRQQQLWSGLEGRELCRKMGLSLCYFIIWTGKSTFWMKATNWESPHEAEADCGAQWW